MKEEKKPTPQKFNIYWIYGAIIFVLLGLSLFGGNDWQTMNKTNISSFEKFLNNGDVSKVVVIRNKSSVRVTLTPEALNKSDHQDIITKNICHNCGVFPVISVPICPLSGEASH